MPEARGRRPGRRPSRGHIFFIFPELSDSILYIVLRHKNQIEKLKKNLKKIDFKKKLYRPGSKKSYIFLYFLGKNRADIRKKKLYVMDEFFWEHFYMRFFIVFMKDIEK